MALLTGLLMLAAVLWLIWQAPPTESTREEMRKVYEYYRKKDAADRRGEQWPPLN